MAACERAGHRRPRAVRAITVKVRHVSLTTLERESAACPEDETIRALRAQRPRTRGDCAGGPRPCPWVSCAHHLYLDANPVSGSYKLNFPDLNPEDMRESCALDVADRDGATLDEVGAVMNITRERVRQLEVRALRMILERNRGLREHADGKRVKVRALPAGITRRKQVKL